MMGSKNSVATRFRKHNPLIQSVKCNLHIEHLAAMKGLTDTFSETVQNLASSTHNYINGSSRRVHAISVLKDKVGLKHLKFLNHSKLRWLSTKATYTRLCRR